MQRAMSSGGGSEPGLDLNAFNNQEVDARKDKTISELLAEFRQGHEKGCEMIASLPDELLTFKRPHPFQGGMSTVLEMIQRSCLHHEAQHLMDIARVLRE